MDTSPEVEDPLSTDAFPWVDWRVIAVELPEPPSILWTRYEANPADAVKCSRLEVLKV
jgi:hypothetical protein